MSELKKTPLNALHHKLGAKMAEFGGFEMPIQYTTIVEEHHRVRREVGLFDLCHMGRINVKGKDALAFIQNLITNDISKMGHEGAHYSLVLNERGTVLDDIIVYNRGAEHYFVVCNASNRDKIVQWFKGHLTGYQVQMTDDSDSLGMIAIQGAHAEPVTSKMLETKIEDMKYYSCRECRWKGLPVLVARTGYTGEDGFEIYLDVKKTEEFWNDSMAAGKDHGIAPVGLAARDTLRLEASMPLYGHEITEENNPLEAGLGFAVKLKKDHFIGKEALLKVKEQGITRKLVCMELEGKRIARQHAPIFHEGKQVGEVTSGTFSPTLEKSIAMAYVPVNLSELGTRMEVEVGKKLHPIKVIERPFYSRKK